ncbi:MAG: HpcH/HpaI aldolase/citrate lyase family protein [Oscillospiraceae bacterium]
MIVDGKSTEELKYRVGPLIYMPGLRNDIAEKLVSFSSDAATSAAICLEDTIKDSMVEEAEHNTAEQLHKLSVMIENGSADEKRLPLIFIRVRTPEQIEKMISLLSADVKYLCGFILSKIDDKTFCGYSKAIRIISKQHEKRFYYMPIIENPSLLGLKTRYDRLSHLKDELDDIREHILNVRVGGNDFCKALSMRSSITQTIYDYFPVADLLSDISVTFSSDYVVSAPVWNYFGSPSDELWKQGMRREMESDNAMGFFGKTVIHPVQISEVIENMKVSREDFDDAELILGTADSELQVIKGTAGNRMYEHKVHSGWARKILSAAEIYGIKENCEECVK